MDLFKTKADFFSKPVFLFAALFLFFFNFTSGRNNLQSRDFFDLFHYSVNIEINDTTDSVKGITGIDLLLKKPADTILLDLASVTTGKKGMVVDSIHKNGVRTAFIHEFNTLKLPSGANDLHDTINYRIYYHGIPISGLIISENMYGHRTFFADNWPNRAHNWFPSADHPSARATVDFTITAPSHYQVIATGLLQKKVNLPGKRTSHYWSSKVPVPTKIMVFGAAGFAVEYNGDINGIPYSNWVYPQNAEEGFSDFSVTPAILEFFSGMIGPYPFEKIANVQSTTRYGGMENAGNIFYNERAVTGDHSIKYTIVHEMAHQWFGNSVTESDWPHLWLSEGIATWLTNWYIEKNYGTERLNEVLVSQREKIIEFSRTEMVPVVYHSENYSDLLNPNSYQKGSWVLHMLRRKIGEDVLVRGLVEFYDKFELTHADSDDFVKVMEDVSGKQLGDFFDDWLFSAGHPVLALNSSFSNGRLHLELIQTQQHKMAFSFPLDIRFVLADDTVHDHTFDIMFRRHEFILDLPFEPAEIILDPNTLLLFELLI
jgi:aminopeptidase N